MIYCWYGNTLGALQLFRLVFRPMNLTVHAVMYTYYALAALGYARAMAKAGLNKVITTIQLAQMVGGIVIIFILLVVTNSIETVCCSERHVWFVSVTVWQLFIDKYVYPKKGAS